jgi:O-antigen/teichoic acid export membrane protein
LSIYLTIRAFKKYSHKLDKQLIHPLKSKYLSDHKTISLLKSIGLTSLYRGASAAINFVCVPILLKALGINDYGLWITISTLLSWLLFFDFGISAGLQNKIVHTIAIGEIKQTKTLISSTYLLIATISIVVALIVLTTSHFITWSGFLNADKNLNTLIVTCINIITLSIASQLVLRLLSAVLFSYQKTSINELINCVIQGVILLGTFVISIFPKLQNPLLIVAMIQGFVPVIVWLFCNIYFFKSEFVHISPSMKYVKFSAFKGIIHTSSNFLLIQLYAIVIFGTDNILVARLFNPAEVTVFNITTKYFSIIGIIFGIILIPYWSAIGKAYALSDMQWIIKTIKVNLSVWLLMLFVAVIMLLVTNPVIRLWTNQNLHIPQSLPFYIALYTIIQGYNNIFSIFLTVANKFMIQILVILFIIIVNIPLSILFVRQVGLGLSGIVLANLICILLLGILMTIQVKKILANRASGIWMR